MSVPIAQCSVFIQIWVDTNSVQNGKTTGVYLVDNRTSNGNGNGSRNEGSASLETHCTQNAYICWQVNAIDPNFASIGGTLEIQQIGNSSAWGPGGQPQSVNATTFTGQAQVSGDAQNYPIIINFQSPGQNGITLRVNPTISVAAAVRTSRVEVEA